VVFGFSGVTIVAESTFARDEGAEDSLVDLNYRYFRTSEEGDLFEFGFVAGLVARHDTLLTPATWDRIFSPQAFSSSWQVREPDTTVGTVSGIILPALELVGTVIDGTPSAVPAYHVQITGRTLGLDLWLSASPSAFLRFRDGAEVGGSFQELMLMRSPP
jgi:hypothetical protein